MMESPVFAIVLADDGSLEFHAASWIQCTDEQTVSELTTVALALMRHFAEGNALERAPVVTLQPRTDR